MSNNNDIRVGFREVSIKGEAIQHLLETGNLGLNRVDKSLDIYRNNIYFNDRGSELKCVKITMEFDDDGTLGI